VAKYSQSTFFSLHKHAFAAAQIHLELYILCRTVHQKVLD